MDYYGISAYAALDSDTSAGEAVSKFLGTPEAQQFSREIVSNQQAVISQMSALTANPRTRSAAGLNVTAQWSVVLNGFAAEIPYGKLEEVRRLDGVKRAYIGHVYDNPEPIEKAAVTEGKPIHTYSYDMVGIEKVWKEGYTGKGMLVAVLDSGLDIKMSYDGSEVVRVHEAFDDNSFKSGDPADANSGWELRYTDESLEAFLEDNQLFPITCLLRSEDK